jgi:hypothetical protein
MMRRLHAIRKPASGIAATIQRRSGAIFAEQLFRILSSSSGGTFLLSRRFIPRLLEEKTT